MIVNKYGVIKIDREVVARIAGLAAMDCYGVVGMGAKSVKDGLVHLLKRESFTKGIHVSMVGNVTLVDIHIIVEYGTNIAAIAETLIKNVNYKVKEFVGLDIDQVIIHVVGVRL